MSRFAGLKGELTPKPEQAKVTDLASVPQARRPARQGKKGVVGYFSPELSRSLNVLAAEEDTSVQALMGEALDLLFRSRGKHPYGER
jgi:hypothetical protein